MTVLRSPSDVFVDFGRTMWELPKSECVRLDTDYPATICGCGQPASDWRATAVVNDSLLDPVLRVLQQEYINGRFVQLSCLLAQCMLCNHFTMTKADNTAKQCLVC
jgi:hypothetical protein